MHNNILRWQKESRYPYPIIWNYDIFALSLLTQILSNAPEIILRGSEYFLKYHFKTK